MFISALQGQEGPREQVTVTATAQPVPFENLARSVRVITRDEIESLPAQSLADLLRYAASVDVRSRGSFGIQSDFSIRGAGFGQVLVMLDGVRLNDSQSGHHNGDIPVSLHDVERIEVLYGPGSSLHGGDALAGAINIITRKSERTSQVTFSGGEHGLFEGAGTFQYGTGSVREFFSFWGNRSSGFMFDRDFRTIGVSSLTSIGDHTYFRFSHLDKDFGANGFYGPSPSREWTDATLVSFEREDRLGGQWSLTSDISFRRHGDHFLWDLNRPGFAENFHRTYALSGSATFRWNRSDRTHVSLGAESGGDWIDSNNLGEHHYSRGGLFVSVQQRLADNAVIYPELRYDSYSRFGQSVSPSLSGILWIRPDVKLRSSVGRAFRIPTFTELYYTDPAHQASSDMKPEKAWGVEAGVDWLIPRDWVLAMTIFNRWQTDAIDWVRVSPAERWITTNVRNVRTQGAEMAVERLLGKRGHLKFQYTYLSVDAPEIDMLSKYVLDYSRHSVAVHGIIHLPGGVIWGSHVDLRHKVDGEDFWIVNCRFSKPLRHFRVFVEVFNLLDWDYQEIQGVDMPGRWLRGGVSMELF